MTVTDINVEFHR